MVDDKIREDQFKYLVGNRSSKLLIEEPALQVLPTLAVAVGLEEAIILQQLHYWMLRLGHLNNGRLWIYNSYIEWQQQFPFLSVKKIGMAFRKMEGMGIIRSGNFNSKASDRTKWYSIDYDSLSDLELSMYQNGTTNHPLLDAHSDDSGHSSITETTPETTPEKGVPSPMDPSMWPEYFSLGHGLKGWKTDVATAEAWREKSTFTLEFCLAKIYVVRSQHKDNDRRDPYMVFQRACRENWGDRTPTGNGRATRQEPSNDLERYGKEF